LNAGNDEENQDDDQRGNKADEKQMSSALVKGICRRKKVSKITNCYHDSSLGK